MNVTTDRIDVHCHCNGGVVQQVIERTGYRPRGGYVVGRWTVDGTLRFMDRHGIGAQILSLPLVMPASVGDAGFAVRFARQVNEDLAALIQDRPERFGAFATVPLNDADADATLAETAYALDELGLDGVVLTSNAEGHYFGLFGTDFPAAPERTIGHNIENFMAFAGFDSTERAGVEHGNAAALFPRFG